MVGFSSKLVDFMIEQISLFVSSIDKCWWWGSISLMEYHQLRSPVLNCARFLFTEAFVLLFWCVQVVDTNASGMPIVEEPLVSCLWNNSMCDRLIF